MKNSIVNSLNEMYEALIREFDELATPTPTKSGVLSALQSDDTDLAEDGESAPSGMCAADVLGTGNIDTGILAPGDFHTPIKAVKKILKRSELSVGVD